MVKACLNLGQRALNTDRGLGWADKGREREGEGTERERRNDELTPLECKYVRILYHYV